LAKLLNAYVGTKKEQEAVTEQQNLAKQYQKDVATDLASIFRDMRAPAQPGMVMGDDTMQGARPAGYLDPANLQAMKTPIGQQTYMAQLLAKPEAPTKGSPGDVFFDRSGKEIFRVPDKAEFGTTPQYEKDPNSPTGYSAVVYGKNGERKVVGPANPVNQFTTPTVDAAESLKQRKEESDRNFNQLSANQKAQLANEAQRIGISAQELFFNTGMGAPTAGAPVGAVTPRPAPITAAPTGMPTAAPTTAYTPLGAPPALSPKAQQDIAVAAAKETNKKEREMEGLGSLIDDARNLLSGKAKNEQGEIVKAPLPTQSFLGETKNALARVYGGSPEGAAQADQLRVLSGSLTLKMPRMEGPQADADSKLYREMAGQIGDSSLSVQRRLAALQQVESLYRKYDKSSPTAPAMPDQMFAPPPPNAVRRVK
jgi:hypothetical protein